jgi:magnesium-transporting ATPase (P-type)
LMSIHQLSIEQSLASLQTTAAGLAAPEALRRLAEFGPNQVEEIGRAPLLLILARQFTHFFAIILWLGAGLAFLADRFDPGQGMVRLGVAIVGVIIVNGIFSFWQEYKAEQAVAALRQLLPQKVQVLRGDVLEEILASALVPGDILLLEEGNFVAADCRLIAAFALRVNMATLTGESLPMARTVEPSSEDSALYAKNVVLAGTSVVSGQARALVYATGMRSEFGRIAHLTQTAAKSSSPLQLEIARLSRIVALLATGMGAVLFLVGQAMGLPTWENLLFAIGIIVANVPEGLLPTVTLSLAMATQRMAKRNALVRHLPAVETLGSTTTICCDKTGTLTQNRMSVQRLWLGGDFLELGELDKLAGPAQQSEPQRQLFINAALCHSLRELGESGQQQFVGDPMEIALANMGRQVLGPLATYTRLDEIPFDTERKRMSVLVNGPQGQMLYCKGAPETVLACCEFILLAGAVVALDAAAKARLLAAQQ